ncbi:heterokaryon incompatibility protein [Rutstroemia sp. NJR-2017a WRK4]|nr:heterokaryon incompatibility protein [Rutstroemia sp. NJR-2017a WRK4]
MSQAVKKPFVYMPLQPGEVRLLYPIISQDSKVKEASWCLKIVKLWNETASLASPVLLSSSPPPSCSAPPPVLFHALSYTWGALNITYPLILYDGDCQEPLVLQIHSNLHTTLPYLACRPSAINIPLWIDAICINQADETEKLVQIRRMHQLYRAAEQVCVWLGDGGISYGSSTSDLTDEDNGNEREPGSEQESIRRKAVELLPLIAEAGEATYQRSNYNHSQARRSYDLPPLTSPVWHFIHALLDNPWFCRLWIVQEVALARRVRVLFGEQEIDWNLLGSAVNRWSSLKRSLKISAGTTMGGGSLEHKSLNQQLWDKTTKERDDWPVHMIRIICGTASGHHCYDPRDRVFGVIGFLSTDQLEKFKLQDRLSVAELYVRITRFLLASVEPSKEEFWDLFNLGINHRSPSQEVEGHGKSRLPSWCPDYHHISGQTRSGEGVAAVTPQTNLEHLPPRNRRLTPAYAASPLITLYSTIAGSSSDTMVCFRPRAHADQDDEPHKITVSGQRFDTIKKVYPTYPQPQMQQHDAVKRDSKATLLAIHAWEETLARDILDSLTSDDRQRDHISLDDYWRTLVGNIVNTTEYTLTIGMFLRFREALDTWAAPLRSASTANSDLKLAIDASPTSSPSLISVGEKDQSFTAERPTIRAPEFRTFLRGVATAQTGRRMFMTIEGRLGFGPRTAEVGDLLCVLNWSRVPHVLRRKFNRGRNTEGKTFVAGEGEEDVYEVVGQAYVHGMMNGEISCLRTEESEITLI